MMVGCSGEPSGIFCDLCCVLLLKVAEDLVSLAYESGINLFDTAEVYNGGR